MCSLKLLRAALGQDRDHLRCIEARLKDTSAALATARAELSEARAGELRAHQLSQHDSLTEMPNRTQFRRRLDDALGAGPTPTAALAVLFLDLDDFKPINDRHGHDIGDELLRIVAQRLSRIMREGDLVCRLGGDEFACLLPNAMGHAQLSRLAAQMFDAVSAPVQVATLELSVRPSIGIAVFPTDGDTTSALLQRADAAMYHAKRQQLGYAFAASAGVTEVGRCAAGAVTSAMR